MKVHEALTKAGELGIGWVRELWLDDAVETTQCCIIGAVAYACADGDLAGAVAGELVSGDTGPSEGEDIVAEVLGETVLAKLSVIPPWNDNYLTDLLFKHWQTVECYEEEPLQNAMTLHYPADFKSWLDEPEVWTVVNELLAAKFPDLAELEVCER